MTNKNLYTSRSHCGGWRVLYMADSDLSKSVGTNKIELIYTSQAQLLKSMLQGGQCNLLNPGPTIWGPSPPISFSTHFHFLIMVNITNKTQAAQL
jgi:hypothetical protein